ncbi:hypothetical protein HYV70_00575 [Candidatus Uhrbacteria bacterium]|nr:hypothetical protein [Candidatus Uhrbacteria bacterium]
MPKIVEEKLKNLERRLRAVELGVPVKNRQRHPRTPSSVWEKTFGLLSKKKANAFLKVLKQMRKTSDRDVHSS